ncbi:hypothetical protein CC2G_005348 [Coprinopsis cinerea AmutBmut pab1-1]|nr:hypothetical protein CC2G_005348 [Coprinopsis cinerea AmutBmut pab1-1]
MTVQLQNSSIYQAIIAVTITRLCRLYGRALRSSGPEVVCGICGLRRKLDELSQLLEATWKRNLGELWIH